jgi:hypothetical protein
VALMMYRANPIAGACGRVEHGLNARDRSADARTIGDRRAVADVDADNLVAMIT